MPDFLLSNIDDRLAVRIKEHARQRQLTINQAFLELIESGLEHFERSAREKQTPDPKQLHAVIVHWNDEEAGALADALKALERLPRAR
jgi:hypothetical protein